LDTIDDEKVDPCLETCDDEEAKRNLNADDGGETKSNIKTQDEVKSFLKADGDAESSLKSGDERGLKGLKEAILNLKSSDEAK
jgi:hypothetical protein